MRRIAALLPPGEAKTDAKAVPLIADAPRARPHTLRARAGEDETISEREMIVAFDDDAPGEAPLIVPNLAAALTAVLDQRQRLAGRIEELLKAFSKVLTPPQGPGVRTGAWLLTEVDDGTTFPARRPRRRLRGPRPPAPEAGFVDPR